MNVGCVFDSFNDSPSGTSIVFFFPKCNLRCPYCYNKTVVESDTIENGLSIERAKSEILKCKRKKPNSDKYYFSRDWMILSGGECTFYEKEVNELIDVSKSIGQKVGIYSNGVSEKSQNMIKVLLGQEKLDFLNIDFKVPVSTSIPFKIYSLKFLKFIKFLIDYSKKHQNFILRFATVAVKQFFEIENYFEKISKELKDCGFYKSNNLEWKISAYHCDDYSTLIDPTFTKRNSYINKNDIHQYFKNIIETFEGNIRIYE